MKVLHVLESSIPDTGGYTIRARAIVDNQRRLGLEPVVVTSPLALVKDRAGVRLEHYDGVPYYRTNYIPAPSSARSNIVNGANNQSSNGGLWATGVCSTCSNPYFSDSPANGVR